MRPRGDERIRTAVGFVTKPFAYVRWQDKAREMETVRGLTWGSSVFPETAAAASAQRQDCVGAPETGRGAPLELAAAATLPVSGSGEGEAAPQRMRIAYADPPYPGPPGRSGCG